MLGWILRVPKAFRAVKLLPWAVNRAVPWLSRAKPLVHAAGRFPLLSKAVGGVKFVCRVLHLAPKATGPTSSGLLARALPWVTGRFPALFSAMQAASAFAPWVRGLQAGFAALSVLESGVLYLMHRKCAAAAERQALLEAQVMSPHQLRSQNSIYVDRRIGGLTTLALVASTVPMGGAPMCSCAQHV